MVPGQEGGEGKWGVNQRNEGRKAVSEGGPNHDTSTFIVLVLGPKYSLTY